MKNKNLRHGDWLLKVVETLPKGLQKAANKITSENVFRFATGEATNHHHELKVKNPENMIWFKDEFGNYYVDLREEGVATHPEHSAKNDLIVAPGIYKVYQANEVDWFSQTVRKVID